MGLTLATSPPARAQNGEPSAAELYQNGLSDLEAGQIEAAKAQLYRVDPMQLPKEQRVRLYEALKQLDAADAGTVTAPTTTDAATPPVSTEAPASSMERLEAAATAPPREAAAIYAEVAADASDPDAAAVAQARLAQLNREQDAKTMQAKRLLDEASDQLAAGDLALAQASLEAARDLDAQLGWFDQQRLQSQLDVIAEQRTQIAANQADRADTAQARADEAARGAAGDQDPALAAALADAEAARNDAEVARRQARAAVANAASAKTNDVPAASGELIRQAQLAYAQDLAANAADAQRQGYHDLAINLYNEATELDPNNEQLKGRLDAAVQARDAKQAPLSPLEEQQRLDAIQRQAAEIAYENAMNEARAALGVNDFAAANDAVANAKIALDRNARLYATAAYNQRRAAANDLAVSIQQRQEQFLLTQKENDARIREGNEEQAIYDAERAQREKIKELIVEARALQRQMRQEEALVVINQALSLDPQNIPAQAIRDILEDLIVLRDQRDFRRQRDVMIGRHSALNLEATIPYDDLLVYPTDWPQLTQRRLEALDVTGGESRQNREASLKLDTPVPVNFEANPLEAVISYLRTTTGVNIFVNWPALNFEGIEEDMPITLQLAEVPARTALDKVLQLANAASGTTNIATYSIIDGVVEVSTQSELNRTTEARVYDIRDLLVQVPNFTDAPEFELGEALQGGGGAGGGGGGQSIFGDTDEDDDDEDEEREELIEQIITIIQDSVGTIDEWESLDSTVQELNGNLIIKTTPQNHRQIVGVLGDLREQRATQINVEARFLLVDNNFLEEFGVDLDFRYKSTGNFSPIVVEQDSIGLGQRGGTSLTPGRFGAGGGDVAPNALSLGVSFIDDLEVDLLVNATQAHNRSLTLTAPRVTFFNGQRAYVLVARQIAFISDLEPVPDTNSFDVTTAVVNSGVVLDVEGTVSADRRYVTMTMRPSLATLQEPIDQIRITGASDGGDLGGGAVFEGFIQLPELEVTQVRSTVSVPDKGTLLLGGQRLVGEVELEAGVPVLSKLPILNRLFTNTSTVKDERTLLILIKPTIILQSEQEELLFPGLNDDPAKYNVGNAF